MNIMELGAIGELVGGVAVIATLLYLAMQVRHTKSELVNVRTENVMMDYGRWWEHLADADVARVWDLGISDYHGMERQDQLRFHAVMVQAFGTYIQSWKFDREGIFPPELFEAQEQWFARIFNTPGGASWLEATAEDWPEGVVERFRGRTEHLREGHPLVPAGAHRV